MQVLFTVAHLIIAAANPPYKEVVGLANTPLEYLSLHLTTDGPALGPGLALSEIAAGRTEDTLLIIKSRNDMDIDTTITLEKGLRLARQEICLEKDNGNIRQAQKSMQDLYPDNGIVKLKIPGAKNIPDLLFSDEIYTAEKELKITMPVEKLLGMTAEIIVLIGVSGCGKTRTCYDFCRSQWAIYFDCYSDMDFSCLCQELASRNPPIKTDEKQSEFESVSAHLINCLLVTRLLVLDTLKIHDPHIQPFEWLCIQRSARTRTVFAKIFNILISVERSAVLKILGDFRNKFNAVRLIFDESQSMLDFLTGCYRSCVVNYQGISVDGKPQYPGSLFSFFTSQIIRFSGFQSIWCGTHMKIRTMDLFHSAAGRKYTSFEVFTDFNYLEPDQIFALFEKWLDVDFESNSALLEEIAIFLQGRPRFLTSFLIELATSKDLRTAFDNYYKEMTTRYETSTALKSSPYFFWKDRFEWSIKGFQSSGTLSTAVHEILIRLCTSALFGDGSSVEFSADLDLVSTGLIMINKTPNQWQARMAEPIALMAGMNFVADYYEHLMMDRLAAPLFSPFAPQYLTPSGRGVRMEMIIALRFLQGWWREEPLKRFLPDWFDHDAIEKPLGVRDLRFQKSHADVFLNQLDDPNDRWLLIPSSLANPDLRYSVFCCYIKTTWVPKSGSSLFVSPEECKKNLGTMNPQNWYASMPKVQSQIQGKLEGKRLIHMRFELPDTAPSLKATFQSGPLNGTNDHVICVSLESEFGRVFFGDRFVSQYKDFLNRTISKK